MGLGVGSREGVGLGLKLGEAEGVLEGEKEGIAVVVWGKRVLVGVCVARTRVGA